MAAPTIPPRLATRASAKLLPGSCQPHRGTESPEGATIGIAQSAHYHANDEGMRDGQRMEMQIDTINARHSPKYFGLQNGVSAYTLVANHVPINPKIIGAPR